MCRRGVDLGPLALLRIPYGQTRITPGPAYAIGSDKLQALAGVLHATGYAACSQAPGCGGHDDGGHWFPLAQLHVLDQYIGCGACELAALYIGPNTHAAAPLADVGAQIHIVTQLAPVHIAKQGIHLARPGLDLADMQGQHRVAKLPLHRKAITPLARGAGIESKAVAKTPVAQYQVHIGQVQRRCTARFIGPAQLAVANRNFGLAKEPVARRIGRIVHRAQLQAGNPDRAIGGAPDVQRSAFDV